MNKREQKIVEMGKNLTHSLCTVTNLLIAHQGLDSALIMQAESLVQRLKENNEKHNKLVDEEEK